MFARFINQKSKNNLQIKQGMSNIGHSCYSNFFEGIFPQHLEESTMFNL